jgi:hypothetical protein
MTTYMSMSNTYEHTDKDINIHTYKYMYISLKVSRESLTLYESISG